MPIHIIEEHPNQNPIKHTDRRHCSLRVQLVEQSCHKRAARGNAHLRQRKTETTHAENHKKRAPEGALFTFLLLVLELVLLKRAPQHQQ
jgi:hypothetical protein